MVYQITKSLKNTLFFAFNPLILIETLVSGHNDIVMMVLAVAGLYLFEQKKISEKIISIILLFASVLIKGATIVLLPLLFVRKFDRDRLLLTAYCLLSIVFFIAAPIREELYPWYAVWLVCIVSFLPIKKHMWLYGFTTVLTFALELRHLPYMWMGYYEGPGPVLRTILTVVPVGIYIVYTGMQYLSKRQNEKI